MIIRDTGIREKYNLTSVYCPTLSTSHRLPGLMHFCESRILKYNSKIQFYYKAIQ